MHRLVAICAVVLVVGHVALVVLSDPRGLSIFQPGDTTGAARAAIASTLAAVVATRFAAGAPSPGTKAGGCF